MFVKLTMTARLFERMELKLVRDVTSVRGVVSGLVLGGAADPLATDAPPPAA